MTPPADVREMVERLRSLADKTAKPNVFHDTADMLESLSSQAAKARGEAIEEAAKAARDACEPFLTDRNTYVLQGPAGMAHAMLAAIRALHTKT